MMKRRLPQAHAKKSPLVDGLESRSNQPRGSVRVSSTN